jgi:hypothetical protein
MVVSMIAEVLARLRTPRHTAPSRVGLIRKEVTRVDPLSSTPTGIMATLRCTMSYEWNGDNIAKIATEAGALGSQRTLPQGRSLLHYTLCDREDNQGVSGYRVRSCATDPRLGSSGALTSAATQLSL